MRLLTAVAVALLPAYAFRLLWLIVTDGTGRVVNGVLTFDGASWVVAVVGSLVWAAAVFLGVAVLDAGPRALRRTLRALPAIAILVGLVWACLALAFLILDFVVPAPPPISFFFVAVLGIAAVGVATPVTFGVTGVVIQGASKAIPLELTGKRWKIGFRYALGVAFPLILALSVSSAMKPDSRFAAIFANAFSALVLTLATALGSVTLLNTYLSALPDPQPPRRQRAARWMVVAGLAALFVPAALNAVGIAGAGLPSVTRTGDLEVGQIVAISWPAERHPTIVGEERILDCLDDACTHYATTPLSVTMYEPIGNAVIEPDGTVYAFGQAAIEICDAQRHCESGSQRELIDQIGYPRAAHLVVGPDGNPIIAAVGSAGVGKTAKVTLHRCHDRLCKTSDATELGTVPSLVPADSWDRRRVSVDLGSDGRVGVAVKESDGVRIFGDRSAEQTERLNDAFRVVASAERPGGGFYNLITDHSAKPVLLQAGSAERETRAVLQVCADRACDREIRRVPVDVRSRITSNWPPPQPDELWLMAVSADGRVALICPYLSERIFTVSL